MKTDLVLVCFYAILPFFCYNKILCLSFICLPVFRKFAPELKRKLVEHNITGKDLHKKEAPIIPESFGILPSLIYILYQYIVLPHPTHTTLLAVILIILLGFMDYILDLPWRTKIVIPLLASIPICQNF